ncbi:Vacuolar protein-sorting-associated protein 28 [Ascosphaera pollenicola]|nr:Vacuolar protein-sorting-associated protein 28 [Ascosphaera pollenicola]
MAGSAKKATKKFEKKHLKDTIDRRREFAKVKQRHRLADKKRSKREATGAKAAEDEVAQGGRKTDEKEDRFANMNVDDFFAGGFDIPEELAEKKTTIKKDKKDVQPKIGKRKRAEDKEQEQAEDEEDSEDSEDEISALESDAEEAGSDEDDEDVEDAEDHMKQLEALKDQDPEFYKYLKENDSELLDFEEHGDLAELDEMSDEDVDIPGALPKKKKKKAAKNQGDAMQEEDEDTVTMAMVQKWNDLMKNQHSLRATRQAVLAFRSAAYISEAEAEEKSNKYTISDPNVYHQVLVTALELAPHVLAHHLPTKTTAAGKVHLSVESKKFKNLTSLIKSHTSSVVQLLTGLTDPSAMKLTLKSIEPLLPYILPFRKLIRAILKTVVGVWSDNSVDESTRIIAFLVIRKTMVIGDSAICTAVVKSTYEGIVKGSRNTTPYTLAGINLMKNSAAELWGIDQNVAYTAGFNFIRQLAMHLRSSITQPSKDSYKKVYNWQYVHSLDFWSRVLSMHCDALVEAKNGKPSALRPLIYPVVQITLGAMRLIPTAQYFPLRFHLVRSLLRISRTTGTFIPLAAPLLEVFNSAEMKKVPKMSTARPFDFTTNIRTPKSYLRTRVYQDGAGEEALDCLAEYHLLWTKSIAFPELALPVIVALKRWLKAASSRTSGNKNSKVNNAVMVLVQKLELNSKWIEQRRQKVSFAPRDRSEVEAFLKETEWESTPLGAYVKTLRRQKEEKEKIIAAGREERHQKKSQKAAKEVEEDDIMDESKRGKMSQQTDGLGRTRGAHRQNPPSDDENTLFQRKRLANGIGGLSEPQYRYCIWTGECTVKLRDRFDLYYEATDEEENEEIHLYKRSEVAVRVWAAVYGDGRHSALRFVPRTHPRCQLRWPPEQGEWRAEQAQRVREAVTEWNRERACEIQPNSAYGVPCSVLLSGPQLDVLEQNYHEISSQTDIRRLIPSWEWLDKYGDELLRAIQSGRSRQHSSETSRDLRLCPNAASYMEMLELGLEDFRHRGRLRGGTLVHDNHPSSTSQMAQDWMIGRFPNHFVLPILSTHYNPMNYVWKKLRATLLERNPFIIQEPTGSREEGIRDLQYSLQLRSGIRRKVPSEENAPFNRIPAVLHMLALTKIHAQGINGSASDRLARIKAASSATRPLKQKDFVKKNNEDLLAQFHKLLRTLLKQHSPLAVDNLERLYRRRRVEAVENDLDDSDHAYKEAIDLAANYSSRVFDYRTPELDLERYEFAKIMTDSTIRRFRSFVWIGECTFRLDAGDRENNFTWHTDNKSIRAKSANDRGTTATFLAAVRNDGKASSLQLVPLISPNSRHATRFVTTPRPGYVSVLSELLDHGAMRESYVVVQKDSRISKSQDVKKWLERKQIKTLSAPAYSPQLNFMEYIWAQLKEQSHAKEILDYQYGRDDDTAFAECFELAWNWLDFEALALKFRHQTVPELMGFPTDEKNGSTQEAQFANLKI